MFESTIGKNNNTEEADEKLYKEGEEMLKEYLKNNQDIEKIPYTKEHTEKIENLLSSFEERFPLDQLMSITTAEKARVSPLRDAAKKEYENIHYHVMQIKEKTDISSDELDRLIEKKTKILLAIGFVNDILGKVRHE